MKYTLFILVDFDCITLVSIVEWHTNQGVMVCWVTTNIHRMPIHSSILAKNCNSFLNLDQKSQFIPSTQTKNHDSFLQSRPKNAIHSSIRAKNRNSFLQSVCSSCPKFWIQAISDLDLLQSTREVLTWSIIFTTISRNVWGVVKLRKFPHHSRPAL